MHYANGKSSVFRVFKKAGEYSRQEFLYFSLSVKEAKAKLQVALFLDIYVPVSCCLELSLVEQSKTDIALSLICITEGLIVRRVYAHCYVNR